MKTWKKSMKKIQKHKIYTWMDFYYYIKKNIYQNTISKINKIACHLLEFLFLKNLYVKGNYQFQQNVS